MTLKLLFQLFAATNIALLGVCAYSFNSDLSNLSSTRSGMAAWMQTSQPDHPASPLPNGAQ